jgi:protein SCO1
MKSINRRGWLGLAGSTLAAGAATARGSAQQEAPGGPAPQFAAADPREIIRQKYFPNLTLKTHEGRAVRFYDDLIKDRVVLINMMYATCEGVCPRITSNLVKVQKLLGDRVGRDIFMYSITLKPEQDTPEVLARHIRMHKIGPGWTFLTGAPADVETLRRRLGFIDLDPVRDRDTANHIGLVRYGNEARHLWASCPGLMRASSLATAISRMSRPDEHERAAEGGAR